MSEQPPENKSASVNQSVLVRDKLNVVGENHKESGARRTAEMWFAKEMTGSENYWTETKFPDLHLAVGSREKRGGQGQAKAPIADVMELRAAHGVAMLINAFDNLCDGASSVAKEGDNAYNSDKAAKAVVLAFLRVNMQAFVDFKDRVVGTWEPTASPNVNQAVQAVYDNIGEVLAMCFKDLRAHKAAPKLQLQAIGILANKRATIDALLPPLLTAVGEPPAANVGELADEMRARRSTFMGLAAGMSKQLGVWKIGDFHVDDLKDETVKIDMSKANFVSKDDFNQEFEAWRLRKREQLLLQKRKLQQQQVRQQQPRQQQPRQPNT